MRPAAVCAGIGAVALAAAATFDAEPLWVPGAAFVVLAASAVAWVLAGSLGVVVTRTVAAQTVLEGQPGDVRLTVRAGLTPLLTGTVEDPLLGEPVPLALGRREMALRVRATFTRRGRRVLAPVRVVLRDPLGLASRERVADAPSEVLVLPALQPVLAPEAGSEGGLLSPKAGRPRMAAEIELDGLRPHRPGAPASRIHWGVFARTDELWERKLLADADSRPLVVLDPRVTPGPEGEEGLDAAVRAVGSLAVALARQGGCALLLPGDRRPAGVEPGLAGWHRTHVRLALVQSGEAPSFAGLAGRAGPVLYVSARPAAGVPRALQGGAGGVRILVVPGERPPGGAARGAGRALFSVAGCTGWTLRDVAREAA